MIKKIAWQAEQLDHQDNGKDGWATTTRIKVIGGWLLSHIICYKHNISETMVFIADRDHEWTIIKPVEEKPQPNKLAAADFKAPA